MVKSKLVVSGALILAFTSSMAMARDDRLRFPVSEAMNAVEAKEKLGDQVKFYFGDQAHPAVAKSFGVDQSTRKTSGFKKSDQQACDWAFLSAMIAFRDKAIQSGADAVINIRSNYKNTEFSSATEYECGAGGIMAGVTFKGEIVKLK